MQEIKENAASSSNAARYAGGFLAFSLAVYGMMRKGNYQLALRFYSEMGSWGLNLYKKQADGRLHRRFAIDYHPFWDDKQKERIWRLHYHRGESYNQIKKHRPYEGGW